MIDNEYLRTKLGHLQKLGNERYYAQNGDESQRVIHHCFEENKPNKVPYKNLRISKKIKKIKLFEKLNF